MRRITPAGFLAVLGLVALLLPLLPIWAQEPSVPPADGGRGVPYRPPGNLVDIGGYRLHLHCMGQGSPPVVLLYGGGAYAVDFGLVQPAVAKFARACTYDRAGDAWSESGPSPRTMRQNAYELHTLLQKAGVDGPYVLAGHSYGGLLAREYARQFPKEVAGIVLIDSTHEDTQLWLNGKVQRLRLLSSGQPIPPVKREAPAPGAAPPQPNDRRSAATNSKVEPPYDKLPPEAQKLRAWMQTQPRHSNMDFLPEELAEMYAARGSTTYPLGDVPLIVLSAGIRGYPKGTSVAAEDLAKDRERLQADLTTLSRNSKRIVAKKSRHEIHLDEPGLVIDAIREVVQAVRGGTPLQKQGIEGK